MPDSTRPIAAPETTAALDCSIHAVAKEAIGGYVGDFDAQKNRRRNYKPLQIHIVTETSDGTIKQRAVQMCEYLAPTGDGKAVKKVLLNVIQTETKEENPVGFVSAESAINMLAVFMSSETQRVYAHHGTAWITLERRGYWIEQDELNEWKPSGKFGYVFLTGGFDETTASNILKSYFDAVASSVA